MSKDKTTEKTVALSEDELTPLLQATASRSLDTCLRGARGLAVLGDPRAFGLLLQLSREEHAPARVEVCRALAALDDPRAINRLRSLLADPEPAVRDAAFTALSRLQEKQPLESAEAGLNSAFEDVHRRALQVLVTFLREKPKEKERLPAEALLVRALNDTFPAVRSEAFKAAVNLGVAGGGVQTLRFVLQSVHADVRLEVLTEVTAQIQEPWAWTLLLEFYNDPDATLRGEAFDFAVRKNKELPPLEAALLSQYPDVRKKGVDGLIKKRNKEAQALLARALADENVEVRQQALRGLVNEEALDALKAALGSPHADIRVLAARALARHGAPEALKPLLDLATAPEPREKERVPDWEKLVEEALGGLEDIGDSSTLAHLTPLLQSQHAGIRKAAARALTWATLPHHTEVLRQALTHSDPQVKYQAALGLAYAGDTMASSLVFTGPATAVLTKDEQLVAAFALGQAGEDQLAVFLDDPDEAVRSRAMFLLMLLELKAPQGAPYRCLACLSAKAPRVRLTGARALERFADREAFAEFVVQLVNDRGDDPAHKVPRKNIEAYADLLAYGSPWLKAASGHLLQHLVAKEQSHWEQAWGLHSSRHAAALKEIAAGAKDRKPPAAQYTADQLLELAFGAYIGLVREQGGAAQSGQTTDSSVVRIRQTALTRIQEMANTPQRKAAIRPVLIQALADPNQAVRVQAFEQLKALGVDADTLGAAALGAGHTDVGIKGLEAMAGGGKSAEGQAVLEEAMLTRTDDLAVEAAKLLAQRRGLVPVAGVALGAAHDALRRQAVTWLTSEYDKSPEAKEFLHQALTSRYRATMAASAFELALKKDPAAYDALVKLLRWAKEGGPQRKVIEAFQNLGDARAADVLLDRIEEDTEGTALTDELFDAVGQYRSPASADRLLKLSEKPDWRDKALEAAITVSGYDQYIGDSEEEDDPPNREWEKDQKPRHDAILARILQKAMEQRNDDVLNQLMEGSRWSRGKDVDPVLGQLAVYNNEDIRHSAVQAIGWRLRKRGGPPDALLKGLRHRDPLTQFFAAEGLALGGRGEGLSILMAAVELQEDITHRNRAVQALGELGDPRAFDLLLKLANDAESPLQSEATEALGHLGKSGKADEILALLLERGRGEGMHADNALRGLRWLDHPDGWALIRRRAAADGDWVQETAVSLLGYHDEPATRDLLLKLLATNDDWSVFEEAVKSARRIWGPDALDPDYAGVQNPDADEDAQDEMLKRIEKRGDARRMLEILPKVGERASRLKAILLARRPVPVAEASAVLAGPDPLVAGTAAHLLGRAAKEAGKGASAVQAALKRWWEEWDKGRQEELRRGYQPGKVVEHLEEPLKSMIWGAGRLGAGVESLSAIASARADQAYDRGLRREATIALATGQMTPAVVTALEKLAAVDDPEVRILAADAVARADAARGAALAAKSLQDRPTFNRLTQHKLKVLDQVRGAAVHVHSQGIALPYLVEHKDVQGLTAVAANNGFSEEVRLGAIEALAAAATEPAEAVLIKIGEDKKEPKELRKAAFRGLRRSRRARKKATAAAKT
jgi:ParB family chromosome partitioning protein